MFLGSLERTGEKNKLRGPVMGGIHFPISYHGITEWFELEGNLNII